MVGFYNNELPPFYSITLGKCSKFQNRVYIFIYIIIHKKWNLCYNFFMKNHHNNDEGREIVPVNPSGLAKISRSIKTFGKILSNSKHKFRGDFIGEIAETINFTEHGEIIRVFVDEEKDVAVFLTEKYSIIQFDLADFHYIVNNSISEYLYDNIELYESEKILNTITSLVINNIIETSSLIGDYFHYQYSQNTLDNIILNNKFINIKNNEIIEIQEDRMKNFFKFPESLEKLEMNSLISTKGLIVPENVIHLELKSLLFVDDLNIPNKLDALVLSNSTLLKKISISNKLSYLRLNTVDSLVDLKNINTEELKQLVIENINSVENFELPENLEKLSISGITSAEGLRFPKNLWFLSLDDLISAKNLIIPESVTFLYLPKLEDSYDLMLPKGLKNLTLKRDNSTEYKLTKKDYQYWRDEYEIFNADAFYFIEDSSPENWKMWEIPEYATNLILNNLASVEGLIIPENITELHLDELKTLKGLVLPRKLKKLSLNGIVSMVESENFKNIIYIDKYHVVYKIEMQIIIKNNENNNILQTRDFNKKIENSIVSLCKKYLGIIFEDRTVMVVGMEKLETITEFEHLGDTDIFIIRHPRIIIGSLKNGVTIYK